MLKFGSISRDELECSGSVSGVFEENLESPSNPSAHDFSDALQRVRIVRVRVFGLETLIVFQ